MIKHVKKISLLLVLIAVFSTLVGCNSTTDQLATLQITSNDFSPQKGIDIAKFRSLLIADLKAADIKGDIASNVEIKEITTKRIWQNDSVQLFDVKLEYAAFYSIAIVKDNEIIGMLNGMPVESVFIADLDHDNHYEVYADVFFGSGIVNELILGFNIADHRIYELSKRMEKDYHLYIEEGVLMVDSTPFGVKNDENKTVGRLAIKPNSDTAQLIIENESKAVTKTSAPTQLTTQPASAPTNQLTKLSDHAVSLVTDYYKSEHGQYDKVYDIGVQPKAPFTDAVSLKSVTLLQEMTIEQSNYAIVRLDTSSYDDNSWQAFSYYFALGRTAGKPDWQQMVGELYAPSSNNPNYQFTKEDVLEVKYKLLDIHFSLYLDGHAGLIGPGSVPDFLTDQVTTEIMEGYEPIYQEGDYWLTYHYSQMDALCYYNSIDDETRINSIEVTRDDVMTYHGIKIGDSRADVLKAYPMIKKDENSEADVDQFVYCANESGLGANIAFQFNNDRVVKIILYNMFD